MQCFAQLLDNKKGWHYDNDSAVFFLTMLLPLTEPVADCGRTEFHEEEEPMCVSPRSALLFDGKTLHRGTANNSNAQRIFAYIAVTSERDANDENNDTGLLNLEVV
jgi:ectoine hydroxylase-related dioxygenase (phytanoyl-CoA dioxygenase family)